MVWAWLPWYAAGLSSRKCERAVLGDHPSSGRWSEFFSSNTCSIKIKFCRKWVLFPYKNISCAFIENLDSRKSESVDLSTGQSCFLCRCLVLTLQVFSPLVSFQGKQELIITSVGTSNCLAGGRWVREGIDVLWTCALIFVLWHKVFYCEANRWVELRVHPVGLPRERCWICFQINGVFIIYS